MRWGCEKQRGLVKSEFELTGVKGETKCIEGSGQAKPSDLLGGGKTLAKSVSKTLRMQASAKMIRNLASDTAEGLNAWY